MLDHSAPVFPLTNEVAERSFRWEYEYDIVDVTQLGDPPNSRPPIVAFRRRLVSSWEHYEATDA